MAGQLAVLTEDWTEEQTARVVDGFLSYIVKTVKECRAEPNDEIKRPFASKGVTIAISAYVLGRKVGKL